MTGSHAWPPHFDEWPRSAQLAYLEQRFKRHELVEALGVLADIDSLVDRDVDPATARLTKSEIAELTLELRIVEKKDWIG